jgi:acetolactate synthase-1/2/3 large subunit
MSRKYSEVFTDWLKEFGYTHCFFLGGGNVMHLLESASKRFVCIPMVHEVGGGIATEYFNEIAKRGERAFVMVTAGPGLTNLVTAIAGAWADSRELLIIGGQAKVSDLARGRVRQIGFQEVDGVNIVKPIAKSAVLADRHLSKQEVHDLTELSRHGKKGPVFIEMCIDISAAPYDGESAAIKVVSEPLSTERNFAAKVEEVKSLLGAAKRPLLLIGGGVSREQFAEALPVLRELRIPIATTFNGADRVGVDYEFYCGRPNWYGMRWGNVLLQQSDVLVALGTRLGIQQTGFQWSEFAPVAKVVQVEIDEAEMNKGFPRVDLPVLGDANEVIAALVADRSWAAKADWAEWQEHIRLVRDLLENVDPANKATDDFVELQKFLFELGDYCSPEDTIIPCSSGGSYTGMMQMFRNKTGQLMVTDKGMASMGYGLSGAIGAAIARPSARTILVEGDGGFAQNMQELGVVANRGLNLKIFLSENQGYASIRTTQKAYFNGNYVGCDAVTGLGFPDWTKLFEAFAIPVMSMRKSNMFSQEFRDGMNGKGPFACVLKLDPEQLYFPKLTSKVLPNGQMVSSALHEMSPPLPDDIAGRVFRWIPKP